MLPHITAEGSRARREAVPLVGSEGNERMSVEKIATMEDAKTWRKMILPRVPPGPCWPKHGKSFCNSAGDLSDD